jgi:pimeloyl-ACP methyl ester carboxylesterase
VDLRGYDILNIVDDLHDLRAALGYDKIVLRGCSFGSQWSLSYLKRWPQTVDRALLSGVEPLDHTYDDPRGLWASMVRLAQLAEADPAFAKHVPRGGLIKSLQNVLQRLEASPVKVEIDEPKAARRMQVTVGADDLREIMRNPNAFSSGTRLDSLANWPRFIAELDAGDYRYLAAKAWEYRTNPPREQLILALIDNSLEITAKRDAYLRSAKEAQWVGDINDFYHNTRDLTPTRKVADDFRADWPIDVPVLLLNGDLDWSTPIENARHLRGFLKQGHLLEIAGGTHCTEMSEVMSQQPALMQKVYSFIDADFSTVPAKQFFASMLARASLAPLKFQALTGPSLYEQWRGPTAKALEPRTVARQR